MTLEEKVDLLYKEQQENYKEQQEQLGDIIKKQGEKKSRDDWDKIQILSTIVTGVLALILTGVNLWTTSKIAEQSQKQADTFHQDQVIEQLRDSIRKERDAILQEINLLPVLQKLSKEDTLFRRTAIGLLEKINPNKQANSDPISSLALQLKSEVVVSNKGAILHIASTKTEKQEKPFWVYLGQKEDGNWQSKNFDINGLPLPNEIIKSIANVYQHNEKPVKISEPDNWNFGKKIGVVKSGSTFQVLDTLTLEGNNYWALVK